MATITKFSFISDLLQVSDGNTVPSTRISGDTVYPNISSGTVCKLSWETPTAANNEVSSYYLKLEILDSTGSAFQKNINIGLVNEYYITPDLINYNDSVIVDVYLQAKSRYGSSYDGIVGQITFNSIKCSGAYVKVSDGYTQPIMKRAVALARVSDSREDSGLLISSDGFELIAADTRPLAEDVLIWSIMKDFYRKNNQGTWDSSDITYEILTDANGEPITTTTGEFIYLK